MDGAFFRQDVLQWLGARLAGYAIKVPFYRWLDLQQYIRAQPTWRPVAPGITGFVVPAAATPWGHPVWVAIYRKHVHHKATKNYQLDLFDPNDGHYEYSAVTSNLDFTLANLWHFACGRGNHEKTIAQLKTGLAFHTVPTMAYAANSAWQHLVVLVHNLLTNFQIETGATRRSPTRASAPCSPCSRRFRRSALCSSIGPRRSCVLGAPCDCDSLTTRPRGRSSPQSEMHYRKSPEFLSHQG
jgi:hypothetical protein